MNDTPFLFRNESVVTTLNGDTFERAVLDGRLGKHVVIKKTSTKQEVSEFITSMKDTDSQVMRKFLLRRHAYPVVAYKGDKTFKVIKVIPDQGKIVLQQGAGALAKVIDELSFCNLASRELQGTSVDVLRSFISTDFKTGSDKIVAQILKIAAAGNRFKRLYDQVRIPARA